MTYVPFYKVHEVWIFECFTLGIQISSNSWKEFLEKCGIVHLSMSRLVVEDEKKWMLAKIKYGF